MRRLGMAAAVIVVLALVVAVALPHVHAGAAPGPGALAALGHSDAHAPDGVRVRVEVLNASHVQGLARRATFYLRDRGFDVLESGNAGKQLDSTLVIDHSGHPEWARLVSRAMGGADVAERPDSSRYLDVTVLVGASWRPPAEPFYP